MDRRPWLPCFPPLEVTDAVRARVAQRLRAPSTPFFLLEDEGESDGDDSAYRKRRSVRSGKIHTVDTNVAVQVRWPHQMVHSTNSRAPVYEEMSLASFTDGYIGIMLVEKDTEVSGVM